MKFSIHKHKEHLIYIALWIVLFLTPVMTAYIRSYNAPVKGLQWKEVDIVWQTMVLFFMMFLIHNFWAAPLLVSKKKKKSYFAAITALTLVFVLVQCQRPGPARLPLHIPPAIDKNIGPPPMMHPPTASAKHPIDFGFNDMIGILILLSLFGLNLGIKIYFKYDEDAKTLARLQQQTLEQQLEYLKYQINPHFLMNTLNNIHALVDIDPERAKEMIVIMSKIMRHMLYEGNKSRIPLKREVDFLQNYIELMRIRYTDEVDITVDIPKNLPEANIPPLLFMTFVENAFKHGVSYRQKSFIHISLTTQDQQLHFACINSKRQDTGQRQTDELQGGVGLNNIRQRLSLLYGNNYHLEMTDGTETYDVHLSLPLS